MNPKSRTTSALLTILFGPLGLFYTTAWGAIGLFVLAVVLAPTVIGALVVWAVSIVWGDSLVQKHNASLGQQVVQTAPEPALVAALAPEPAHRKAPVWGSFKTDLLIAVVLAVAWVFVGKPMLGIPEDTSTLALIVDWFGS